MNQDVSLYRKVHLLEILQHEDNKLQNIVISNHFNSITSYIRSTNESLSCLDLFRLVPRFVNSDYSNKILKEYDGLLEEIVLRLRREGSCSSQSQYSLNLQDVAKILTGTFQHLNFDNFMTRQLFKEFTNLLRRRKAELLHAHGAVLVLYNLKTKSQCTEVRELISFVAWCLKTCSEKSFKRATDAYHALCALQNLNPTMDEVRQVMVALIPLVKNCKEPFTPEGVAMSMRGFHNMKSQYAVVSQLLAVVIIKLKKCKPLNVEQIGEVLYGLQSMTGKTQEVKTLLTLLQRELEACSEQFNESGISAMFFGLQNMTADHCPEALDMLQSMIIKFEPFVSQIGPQSISQILCGLRGFMNTIFVVDFAESLITRLSECQEHFTPDSISICMGCLLKMSCSNEFTRRLITLITNKLETIDYSISEHNISRMLNSLENMSVSFPVVQRLLVELTRIINISTDKFTPLSVGISISGLHNMTNEYPEVCDLLLALVPKVIECTAPFPTKAISNTLYGFHSMSSDSSQVLALLRAVTPHIESSTSPLNSKTIGNAIYGLQNMSSEHSEVRHLIRILTPKIAACNKPVERIEICNATYGLRSLRSDHDEVNELMNVLADRYENCSFTLNFLHFGNILYGLSNKKLPIKLISLVERTAQNNLSKLNKLWRFLDFTFDALDPDLINSSLSMSMGGGEEIFDNSKYASDPTVFTRLHDDGTPSHRAFVSSSAITKENFPEWANPIAIDCLHHSVVLTCFNHNYKESELSITNQLSKEGVAAMEKLRDLLETYVTQSKLLQAQKKVMKSRIPFASATERKYLAKFEVEIRAKYQDFFNRDEARICTNITMHGFECDMVLFVKDHVVNFEMDGSAHLFAKKSYFCKLRDQYLTNVHNIVVKRFDVTKSS